jgi:hypothetical protein
MRLVFEWDPATSRANLQKHRLTFQDAEAVFSDPLARILPDDWHSEREQREIIIGHLREGRLALVVFVEARPGHIRIISARRATAKEQRDYEQFYS